MAQLVKRPDTKPDALSLIPGVHIVEETWFLQVDF